MMNKPSVRNGPRQNTQPSVVPFSQTQFKLPPHTGMSNYVPQPQGMFLANETRASHEMITDMVNLGGTRKQASIKGPQVTMLPQGQSSTSSQSHTPQLVLQQQQAQQGPSKATKDDVMKIIATRLVELEKKVERMFVALNELAGSNRQTDENVTYIRNCVDEIIRVQRESNGLQYNIQQAQQQDVPQPQVEQEQDNQDDDAEDAFKMLTQPEHESDSEKAKDTSLPQ